MRHARHVRAALASAASAAALGALSACLPGDVKTEYDCAGKGYVHRYRDGKPLVSLGDEQIQFRLATWRDGKAFEITDDPRIHEHQNKAIVLDAARSNEVERTYIFDITYAATKMRNLSSLVLNTQSGDVRLFHHRWIPPVEWRDSDQYFFSGNCRKRQPR